MRNENGTNNQAIPIEPFNVAANAFFNYRFRGDSWMRGTKLRFGVNNLQNNHNIVGINAASIASNDAATADHDVRLRSGPIELRHAARGVRPSVSADSP